MKHLLILILPVSVLCACSNPQGRDASTDKALQIISLTDTVVGSKIITDEMSGSAFRKKATSYFMIYPDDTSGFMPVFSESKDDKGAVSLDMNIPYANDNITYSRRIRELKTIVKEAAKEYNLDSLKTVSLGRLILTGDLAVELTEAWLEQYGDNGDHMAITTKDYPKISGFLLNSKLAADFNEVFEPFSLSVKKVIIEKAFFTTSGELLNYCSLERDTAGIPGRILDCITWIALEKQE